MRARAVALLRDASGERTTGAEVDEAVEHEFARTLEDVLGRRLPLILRARDQGLAAAPAVAARMAGRFEWSQSERRLQIDRYIAAVDETRRFRSG